MPEETAFVDLSADCPLVGFLEAVSESLTDGFRELGGLAPLLFVVPAVGEAYVTGPPLANHDSETAHAHIATWIRDHLKKCGAVRYAYAAEMRENGSSQAELVSIEAADYGNAISGIREIIKPKKGKQYLGPLQPVNSPASSAENCCLSEGGSTEFRHVGLAARITPQKEREVPR